MNALTKHETGAIASQVNAGPMAGAIAALQAGMTVEQLRGILDLQKDWEANEARKSYVADMAEFKLNPPQILKDKHVAFSGTAYSHATLGGVSDAVVGAMAKHGFSHSWKTDQSNGLITVTCKITHRLGHSESTSMEAAADNSGKKNAIQAVTSSITYMQRYTLLAACGLATMDMPDDDGQGYDRIDTPSASKGEGYIDPQMFMDMVKDIATDAEGAKLWAEHNGKLAKQPADHAAFKEAVIAKRTEIRNATVTDVNAKPAAMRQAPAPKGFDRVMAMLMAAKSLEALEIAAEWIVDITDAEEQQILNGKFAELKTNFGAN